MKQTKFLKKTNKHPAWSLNATTTALAMAGLFFSSHAVADVQAQNDTAATTPNNEIFINVLANDTYPSKTDGTPMVSLTIPTPANNGGSASVDGNRIKFVAPSAVSEVNFAYKITQNTIAYGDITAQDNNPTTVTQTLGSQSTAPTQDGDVTNQSNADIRRVWKNNVDTKYTAVIVDPDLETLPECDGAKYRISTEFSATKSSGAQDSYIGIRVGSSSETFAADAKVKADESDLPLGGTKTVNYDFEYSGKLSELRVGIFVLNALELFPNSSPSKYEYAPISLKVTGTPDTSGCAAVESTANVTVTVDNDFDGDGVGDGIDLDDDDDGIPDSVENLYDDGDDDGMPNRTDLDSDNDGIPDSVEAGPNPSSPLDTDGDGKPDFLDTDSDNDSINDTLEGYHQPTAPATNQDNVFDTDRDGIPDYRDLDSDNDGIQDVVEQKMADTNGDGMVDSTFVDSNTLEDTDQDKTPNVWDLDSDNDTIPDIIEGNCAFDAASCTIAGIDVLTTTTGSYTAQISNPPQGWATAFRTTSTLVPDTDGDGDDNFLDLDSDGDGVYDIIESGYAQFDENKDGLLDSPQGTPIQTWSRPSATRSVPAGASTVGPFGDTDGDGKPDWADADDLAFDDSVGAGGGFGNDDPNAPKIITGIDGNGGGATGHLWATLLGLLVAVRRVRKSKGA